MTLAPSPPSSRQSSAPSARRQLLAALIVILGALAAVVIARGGATSAAGASRPPVESIFQDDARLIYGSTPTVTHTLALLKRLGVDRVRATILWRALAPAPNSVAPPAGFDATDPRDYPAGAWAPYDRLVALARARGIGVDFNLTAPGPLWATARHPPAARYADHWAPSPPAFGAFVAAVAERYSGRFVPAPGARPLPRVSFWSVWNEPNQPGWLAPQWSRGSGRSVMVSPALYRAYVDAAWRALTRTGHAPPRDTILIGELAPEGSEAPDPDYRSPIPPLPFLRSLYCVDDSWRPLRGAAAATLGCPQAGPPSEFVRAHPGLFQASGFAHHPYSFFLAPSVSIPDPSFVPLSDLFRLERGLDAIFASYGVSRRPPLWLTEYGYETDPPNTCRGVTLREQSLYLNEAQYMAMRDPRVRGFAQFLLVDSPPDTRYPPTDACRYWSTFQTGLEFANGAPKPSLAAYRLPLFLPDPVLGRSRRVLVWAMLRAAPRSPGQLASLQWRPQAGSYRTLARVVAQGPNHVVVDELRVPGPGVVRVAWVAPDGTVQYSRGSGIR